MLEIIDTQKLKKKFGLLLSKLHTDNKFSPKEIEGIILRRDYFDFLERQEPNKFLEDSYELIAKREFNADTVFSEDTLTEFYWAGTMYMSICLNKRIPLKQVMLLCPLEKMLQYFEIYHEMNDLELINKFMKDDYPQSILRKLRKMRYLTVKELALASGIPELTIKYYEKNNNNLFNASFDNISRLCSVLYVSDTYFTKSSRFIPYTYMLFEDKNIFKDLVNIVNEFYKNKSAEYSFDGVLLKRTTNKSNEYVSELYLSSAINKILNKYSKSNELLY